ncbi:MAG: SAM-dependent methyltransferase [Desulfobacterales bacterium]|nr:MAG: SAM-dependent methyltransferase [Desulfobacterales bacterium]
MEERVKHHYACPDLADAIRNGLETAGKPLADLKPRDLAPVDQLHTGGPKATIDLVKKAGLTEAQTILDVGCGIGGTTRLLAQQFHLKATGIDITPDFISAARTLTQWCKMAQGPAIEFHQGSVLNMPFSDDHFDAVICQHILMNIEDKPKALAECHRVLKPGGTIILHEITDGPGPDPLMPVPWGSDPATSFVPKWEGLQTQLEDAGFNLIHFSDETQNAVTWWHKVNTIHTTKGIPPVNTSLIFGPMAKQFGPNLEKNFSTGAIGCIEAIFTKPDVKA